MLSPETVDIILEYGQLGLALLSFCESIFFPIPPDVVLLPMALMNPGLSFWYALLASSASIAGALAGYAIGRKAGRPLVERYFAQDKISAIEVLFSKYGGWAVGIAAFTPIPFKLFTLTGGIFRVEVWPFVIASVVGRGARFFLEGALVYFLGEQAVSFLDRNFDIVTMGLTIAVVAFAWLGNRFGLWDKVRAWASQKGTSKPGRPESDETAQTTQRHEEAEYRVQAEQATGKHTSNAQDTHC